MVFNVALCILGRRRVDSVDDAVHLQLGTVVAQDVAGLQLLDFKLRLVDVMLRWWRSVISLLCFALK